MRLIARLKPYLGGKELMAAMSPSKGNIPKFEQEFAEKFGCKHGTMFSHGRAGLHTLFKVFGLDNDEVICPAYTCVVVQHAIVLSGNIPVFVDCAEGSFNMDYDGIEAAITPQTRAIVVTHLFGYPMDVERVQRIVEAAEQQHGHKIYVIQDAAHSYGAKWNNQLVTSFGDAAIFGSNISKVLTSVFGGMVITKDAALHEKLQTYRNSNFQATGTGKGIKRLIYLFAIKFAFNSVVYAFTNWMERKGLLNRFVKYYDEGIIDFPADWKEMPCELEARVGRVQLKKYDEIIQKRREAATRYIKQLSDHPNIKIQPDEAGATYSHFVVVVENRDEWVEKFFKKGVQLGILIEYSVPEMAAYQKYKRGEYPISNFYSEHCINIPNYPGVPKFSVEP